MSPEILVAILNGLSSVVIEFTILFAAWVFHRVTGRQMQANDRNALHSAIKTGVNSYINHWLTSHPGSTIEDARAAIPEATILDYVGGYIERSVPQALRRLSPLPDVLDDLILSYLPFGK